MHARKGNCYCCVVLGKLKTLTYGRFGILHADGAGNVHVGHALGVRGLLRQVVVVG